ncbi:MULTISPECIES: hypothetical protein [unclassified Nocardioides]|uniref:hypothetical protein n=1 Tax=unclassified Nocardioides TaxID=2615069 RepID=UPI00361868D3
MGLRSRRTRAAEPAPEQIELTEEQIADLDPEAQARVLRAHVRALEQALAAVIDPPAPEPAPVPEPAPTTVADPGLGLRRAALVARAVAARVAPDDDPRLAAERVVACLEQLSAAPGLTRPRVAGEEPPAEAPVLEDVAATLVVVDSETAPTLAAVDGPEVVLPVPPPADPAPRRHRRRLRGSAA